MSRTGCCPPQNDSSAGSSCNQRFEVMDELNRHYNERIQKIEKAGYTELLVCNLKKWIEALVKHDKVLISTIESLENEALKRSEKISQLCKDRLEVEDICQKYKQELCQKSELIKELNTRINEQAETLNQKECLIKRLNEELKQLKKCVEKLQNESDTICEESEQSISDMKCEIDNLRKEVGIKECKINKLEEELCKCRKKLEELKDTGSQLADYRINKIPFIEEDVSSEELNKETQAKLEESQKEIKALQKFIDEMKAAGDSETVETLRKNLENMKRESRDMKEALTAEVAEKHDMITALRRDTAQLEEKARQADMQAIFKDDIIKELRKEVKLARAKESFVEMLGLNEGTRVQMKSKIDTLSAELEEKQCEIKSLENKLEEMNRHALEGKLGEMSLQLMDRERDMIILCNKVDYIKRYLDKLHEDEDISIKCGLKALLLELNEETEWRRKARRSVTSLGDQPESIIIINRSNSLPAESSEHVRYNGRVNELELKLERAREEICCLRKKLDTKETEIMSMREKNYESEDLNRIDRVLMPDSMLSLKIEEFQRFTNESSKKLEETLDDIKQHAGNLLLKEEMDELNCFLNAEQETFFKANRQLHVLLCNIKNTNQPLTTPANFKLQCMENKLKCALEEFEKEKSSEAKKCTDRDSKGKFIDNIMKIIKECLKLVCELKQDAPQVADSNDPVSSASNTKLIQEIQEMIKIIQNQSKIQQSRLYATLDNQKEETGSLCKRFSEVDYLLKSHCKSINYVKDELKLALCNITQKAEKVRKQAEYISHFECSVKDISNWINQNLKNNSEVVTKVCSLRNNLDQIISMKNNMDDSRKEGRGGKMMAYRPPAPGQRQSHSTPELCQSCVEAPGPDLNDFEDKCLIAREICDEVKRELEKAACRINEREHKLTQLSKEVSCFGETVCRIQEDIIKSAHILSGDYAECSDEFSNYEEVASHLQESNKQLIQALHNIKHKLINHHKEADGYDIKGIESRKTIASKLSELEEALNNISDILGEIKESDYIRSKQAFSNESQYYDEEGESALSIVEVPSSDEKLCAMQRNVMTANSYGVEIEEVHDEPVCSIGNQIITPNCLIKELKEEICNLNDTITDLQKQNNYQDETIESLKCQLISTKEEADKAIRKMVSNLQEKCQPMEPLVDDSAITKLCMENKKQKHEMCELKRFLQTKCDKINMMKREYVQLTQEINQLTAIVQEEKESSKTRECDLNKHNTELRKQICWLKQKLHVVCQKMSSQQEVQECTQEQSDGDMEEYKRKLQCVQDNYNTLLTQYRELCRNHENLQRAMNRSMADASSRPALRSREDQCSKGEDSGINEKLAMALKEIGHLRSELKHLNCENERLNKENHQLSCEQEEISKEQEKLMCEQQRIQADKFTAERENFLSEIKSYEDEMKYLRDEYNGLCKNNELLAMENDDLKTEIECLTEKYDDINSQFKEIVDKNECLRSENDKIQMENLKLQKEMSDQLEKSKILRDEDCRENIALKQKYDELKQELKCAEFKIEELEAEISKVEKRNLETAILEADTQLLITKTDQEWNEMYVKKCTEVMELTEEIECLRKKIINMNGQMLEKSEVTNESKRIIAMLKKTLQDYKTQVVCLKSKLEKCIAWNRDMKRQLEALEKSNRSMKQFICFLNKEKKELQENIDRLQQSETCTSECDCNFDGTTPSSKDLNDEIISYQREVDQISNSNRELFEVIQELQISNEKKLNEIKSMVECRRDSETR